MTACTQSRYCCVLSELLGAPVLFNMYSVENSFAAISLSQNVTVCPSLPQNKDTLSHSEDTAICSLTDTPSSPRGGGTQPSLSPVMLARWREPEIRGGFVWGSIAVGICPGFRIFSNTLLRRPSYSESCVGCRTLLVTVVVWGAFSCALLHRHNLLGYSSA